MAVEKISISISPELYTAIEAVAMDKRSSISKQIEIYLRENEDVKRYLKHIRSEPESGGETIHASKFRTIRPAGESQDIPLADLYDLPKGVISESMNFITLTPGQTKSNVDASQVMVDRKTIGKETQSGPKSMLRVASKWRTRGLVELMDRGFVKRDKFDNFKLTDKGNERLKRYVGRSMPPKRIKTRALNKAHFTKSSKVKYK